MATIDTIRAAISTLIPELNNTSSSSILTRILQVFASVVDTILLNISNSEQVIETSARTNRVAGAQYYIDKALAFQYGDSLVVVDQSNFQYGYNTIDESKQIIKQVAVTPDVNAAEIDVSACTQDGDGNNVLLTEDQTQSLQNYLQQLAPLGIGINVLTPDAISTITATALYIRYNQSYSLTTIKQQVTSVLVSTQRMLIGYQGIYVNDLESALANIDGVRDAYFDNLTYDSGTSPANGVITPKSVFFNFDPSLLDLSLVQFIAV